MPDPSIRPLTSDDAPRCDAVIASLPYFFGDPDGRAMCAEAVRSQPGVAPSHYEPGQSSKRGATTGAGSGRATGKTEEHEALRI